MSDRSSDRFTRHARVLDSSNTRRERPEDHINASTPEKAATIDFDGLRGVPVGPRRGIGKIDAKNEIYSPHILIRPEHVPPLPNLIRHLQGMLKTQKPTEISVSEHGWHLFFDNSAPGRSKLKRCYNEFHRKKFFTYELNMQCFLDGSESGNQFKRRARTSLKGNENIGALSDPRPSVKSSPKIGHLAGREISYPDPVWRSEATYGKGLSQKEDDNALKGTPSRVLQQDPSHHLSAEVNAQYASPVNANVHLLSQRSERDDTASQASGVTRSDSSRIKRDKCHVCSGDTGHGLSSLVQCSSCRRKYHRRCHQDPVIPDGLNEDHAWSCRSCVKKSRTHKKRHQVKSVKPFSSLGLNPSESPPLPALNDNGEKQSSKSDAPAPPRVEGQALSGAQVNVAQPDLKNTRLAANRHVTTEPDAQAVLNIGDGDLALSDPDDLVEKSFSAAAAVSQENPQCHKPGKFKMTRIKLPPSVRAFKAQRAQPEEPTNRIASPKDLDRAHVGSVHSLKDSSANEPAAQNSVADLRALAHKAHGSHQSAIRNGTDVSNESHVESEERQIRGIRPASTTDSTCIERPTAQSGVPQVSEPAAAPVVAPTRTDQLEIPESPDEVRFGSLSRDEPNRDPQLLARRTRVSPGLSDEQMSNVSPVQPGKHAASKKSKVPTYSCCSACQKRIPAGPSGLTRLCFGCKRKPIATEASQTVDASTGADPTVLPVNYAVLPTGEQRVALHKDREHAGLMIPDDLGETKDQSVTSSKLHGRVDQDIPAPPSTTQAQHKSVDKGNATHHMIAEAENDTSWRSDVPAGETATTWPGVTPLADPPQMPIPNVDTTSEDRISSTHDGADKSAETTSSRIEYIRSIVGDSHNRPKGSRTILVAMAMSTCPTQRMQAKDILDWISANIPTCNAGEGNWHERVVSQLTQGTRTKSAGGYWLMDEWKEGDGGVPGKKWYKLLPEKADEMWTWDPVLQQPVAPRRPILPKTSGLKRQRASKSAEGATALRGTLSNSSISTPTTPLTAGPRTVSNSTEGLGSSKQGSTTTTTRTPDQVAMDVTESSNVNDVRIGNEKPSESTTARGKKIRAAPGNDHASSDDEPLLKRRRRDELAKPRLPSHEDMQQHTPANTEIGELPDAGDEIAHVAATEHQASPNLGSNSEAPNSLIRSKRAKVVVLKMRKGSLPDGVNKLPSLKNPVTSFYDEWPEYREENMFDAQAKLAEIIKRPTRKQIFGKPALCSRLHVREPPVDAPMLLVNASPAKRTKMLIDPSKPFPWEDSDVDQILEEYKSLDEFFDFPANMIPIISEGQLAYRDGTRNDGGRLPRAREVYKP